MCGTKRTLSRRRFLTAGGSTTAWLLAGAGTASSQNHTSRLGIGASSYDLRRGHEQRAGSPRPITNPLYFLEHCHGIGAGGIQTNLTSLDGSAVRRLRRNAERYGMFVEGSVSPPRDHADLSRFEDELRVARNAGARVIRTAMLGGRRYETFDNLEAFKEFALRSWDSLTLAEPAIRKRRMKLAIENHKDWRSDEMLAMMERISSESVGICVDTGNNIALLEDPISMVEALAPYAHAVHLKDMAVEETAEGFLLSEVPLGDGILDMPKIVGVLREARPDLNFALEMITRNPLNVPCLTDSYWPTMPGVPGSDLARTLAWVRNNKGPVPLPRLDGLTGIDRVRREEQNVQRSLAFAREHLGL